MNIKIKNSMIKLGKAIGAATVSIAFFVFQASAQDFIVHFDVGSTAAASGFADRIIEDAELPNPADVLARWNLIEDGNVQINLTTLASQKYNGNRSLTYPQTLPTMTWRTLIPDTQKDIRSYKQLIYFMKASAAGVTTKVALVEASGEVWVQNRSYSVGTTYSVFGVDLDPAQFSLQSGSPRVNSALDLNDINEVRIITTGSNQNVFADDLTLTISKAADFSALGGPILISRGHRPQNPIADGILANFEDASTQTSDGGSSTRSVLSTQPNFLSISAVSGLSTTGLALSTVYRPENSVNAAVFAGSNACQVDIPFNNQAVSDTNWGVLLSEQQTNGDALNPVTVGMDLSGWQYVSLQARKQNAGDADIQFAVAFVEGGAADQQEMWISDRMVLDSANYKQYQVGLNEVALHLNTAAGAAVGNRHLDVNNIKSVYYFFYKTSDNDQPQTIFLDEIVKSDADTSAPTIGTLSLTNRTLTPGDFQIRVPVSDGGGMNYTSLPVVTLDQGVQSHIVSYSNGLLLIAGTVPSTIVGNTVHLSITGVKDLANNEATLSQDLPFNSLFVPLPNGQTVLTFFDFGRKFTLNATPQLQPSAVDDLTRLNLSDQPPFDAQVRNTQITGLNFTNGLSFNLTDTDVFQNSTASQPGMGALRVDLDFGATGADFETGRGDNNSKSNWGVILLHRNQDATQLFDLSGYQTLGFYAKQKNANAPITMAIGFEEDNGNPAQNERWISEKFQLTGTYQLFSVGLNATALTLDASGPTNGNHTFDASKIKSVYYYIYRGTATGNAQVYMDMVHTRLDDVKPIVLDVTANAHTDTFNIDATVQELGGVATNVAPVVTVTKVSDNQVIPVTLSEFSNSKISVTGLLPVGDVPVEVSVAGITDIHGNVSTPFTKTITIHGKSTGGNTNDGNTFTVTRDGNNVTVTNFGVNHNTQSFQVQNHTQSTFLDFSTVDNKLAESTASMKLLFDFGNADTINNEPNWGALILQNNADGTPYNFAGAQTLSLVAKSTATAQPVQIAVAVQDQDNEVWISRKVSLTTAFQRFGFGLNSQIFKLDPNSAGNRTLDLNAVKNIFFFVYRNGVTGNATVWIDGVGTANDTNRPLYTTANVEADPFSNTFAIYPHFTELGGFDVNHAPTFRVVANGTAVSNTTTSFENDEWVVRGTVPESLNQVVANVSIQGVTDYYGNVLNAVPEFSLNWINGQVPVHALTSKDGLSLFTTVNTLAAGDGFAGLALNFNAQNGDGNLPGFNWGDGITVTPIAQTLAYLQQSVQQNKTLYLTYDIKSSLNTPVKTRIALVEKAVNGKSEIWTQKDSSIVSNSDFFTAGVTLNANAFEQDLKGDIADRVLDLTNVEFVQLIVDRNGATEPVNLSIKNLVIRKQDARNDNLISVLDRIPTTVTVPTDTTTPTRNISGPNVPGAPSVDVILPDGTIIHATVGSDNWNAVVPNLVPGDNQIRVVYYDKDGNPINLTNVNLIYKPATPVIPASVPVLLAESVNTSVLSPAIYGMASEGTVQVRLYVNGTPVAVSDTSEVTQNIQVSSLVTSPKTIVASADQTRYFVFKNIRFDSSRDNRVSVAGIDASGKETSRSSEVVIKWGRRASLRVPGASASFGPVYVDFPVGSLSTDSTALIDASRDPKNYPVTVAFRRLAASPASLVDISINDTIQSGSYAIVSIPIPSGSTSKIQPWYYNPITREWSQDGISNIEIISRTQVDGVSDDSQYIRFRVSHLSIFGVLEVTDQNSPVVTSVKFDDKAIEAEDFVKTSAKIKFSITEAKEGDTGVGAWSIKVVKIDSSSQATSDVTGVANSGNGAGVSGNSTATANLNLNKLDGGRYYAQITVADLAGNSTVVKTPTFNIEAGFAVANVLNGPNPFNPNRQSTHIQYQLSQDADVTIYVYSISGEKLWETKIAKGQANGTAGFNTVGWDGRNKYGEMVANGVYVAYILCDNGSQKILKKVKIAVLK